ncbi:MAG: carboxypeptidase-like regulatory domain-containing protein [Sphingobacteriales bacterium]|nr:MAG: carboxypeptidase-like regulatory domain-containing protein [Sphingobacteriales bacterium]
MRLTIFKLANKVLVLSGKLVRMRNVLKCLLLCCCLPAFAFSQEIKGTVVDLVTGAPIHAATVYINNSTLGSLTDEQGNFVLKGNIVFPVDVVVAAVSYGTRSVRVRQAGTIAPVKLDLEADELPAVKVLPALNDGWERYGKDFIENFISYSGFAGQCEILNKKDLVFKMDTDKWILYVAAARPIRIRNKALGYIIHFDLSDYTHYYLTHEVYFLGYTRFEPMKPKHEKQRLAWEQNRKTAFQGSLNHFIRSVANNNTAEQGFQLNVVVRATVGEYGERVPLSTDTLDLKDTAVMKKFFINFGSTLDRSHINDSTVLKLLMGIKKWVDTVPIGSPVVLRQPVTDTFMNPNKFVLEKIPAGTFKVAHYDTARTHPADTLPAHIAIKGADPAMIETMKKRRAAAAFDYLYTTPWPVDSFLVKGSETVQLFCKDLIQVMYKNELEEKEYIEHTYRLKSKKPEPSPQTSLLIFKQNKPVNVYANGSFTEQYDLFLEGYWSYEKLDKMLPLDYEP